MIQQQKKYIDLTVSFIKLICVREDTHKKSVFFSGRTTKGVGRGNPRDH